MDTQVVREHLDGAAVLDLQSSFQTTAAMSAAAKGQVQSLGLLIPKGADIQCRGPNGETI